MGSGGCIAKDLCQILLHLALCRESDVMPILSFLLEGHIVGFLLVIHMPLFVSAVEYRWWIRLITEYEEFHGHHENIVGPNGFHLFNQYSHGDNTSDCD